MKYIVLIMSLCTSVVFSQTINDAILFSSEHSLGSARYNAMSGAFGALGGDFSAMNDNPAGSAVFKNSLISGSLMYINASNDAAYFGTLTNESHANLTLNQLGGALVFNNTNENSEWKKFVLALNYQQTQNYDRQYYIAGDGTTSVNSYFLSQANGLYFEDIQALPGEYLEDAYLEIGEYYGFDHQQAFLGYYGGVIDPVDAADPLNTMYVGTATIDASGTVQQEYFYDQYGANSKFNFNLATQYKDDLYLGVSFNGNYIDMQRNSRIHESGYDTASALNYVVFDNYLRTTGGGFSMQVGAIGKVGDILRLGASFQTPTWYVLTDELSQRIDSNLADVDIGYINENQVSVFEDYNLRTPMKLTGSAAIVFGKQGLLSVDYNYQDYNNMKMKPSADFNMANAQISNTLQGASSVNLGGEYRVDRWSLRAGYRFEESPYKNKNIMDDLTGYSLGFGYNFGRTKFDFAYNQSKQDVSHQLYETGLTNRAKINECRSAVTASLTFNF